MTSAATAATAGPDAALARPPVPRLSCLVPAHNEADRIGAVLRVLAAHPLIDEVIVIDDGSVDATATRAAEVAKVRVLRLWPNRGKTAALAEGIAQARGRYLMLIDADLTGLRAADITALALPVLQGGADAAISLRGNAPMTWRALGIDYISGERVFPRALLEGRSEALLALPRWGFEVYLNDLFLAAGLRLRVVRWPRVASPSKATKQGVLRGIVNDARMLADIGRTIGARRALRQIAGLRRAAGLGSRSGLADLLPHRPGAYLRHVRRSAARLAGVMLRRLPG